MMHQERASAGLPRVARTGDGGGVTAARTRAKDDGRFRFRETARPKWLPSVDSNHGQAD
jgi:hypothetical protein